jgi:hypothetical protein
MPLFTTKGLIHPYSPVVTGSGAERLARVSYLGRRCYEIPVWRSQIGAGPSDFSIDMCDDWISRDKAWCAGMLVDSTAVPEPFLGCCRCVRDGYLDSFELPLPSSLHSLSREASFALASCLLTLWRRRAQAC